MARCLPLRWRFGASPGDPQKLEMASFANVSPPARRLTDEVDYFRIFDYTGGGQTSFKEGPGRGMISSDICLKLCGWEIRDEGSDAA